MLGTHIGGVTGVTVVVIVLVLVDAVVVVWVTVFVTVAAVTEVVTVVTQAAGPAARSLTAKEEMVGTAKAAAAMIRLSNARLLGSSAASACSNLSFAI